MRVVALGLIQTPRNHRAARAVEMIQVELAQPEVIEVPVSKIGAHDEVPRDLSLDP